MKRNLIIVGLVVLVITLALFSGVAFATNDVAIESPPEISTSFQFEGMELKSFFKEVDSVSAGWILTEDYTVPVGKTLYITNVSFRVFPVQATDYDHHTQFEAYAYDVTSGNVFTVVSTSFGIPAVVPGGHKFRIRMINYTNFPNGSIMQIHAMGYEE